MKFLFLGSAFALLGNLIALGYCVLLLLVAVRNLAAHSLRLLPAVLIAALSGDAFAQAAAPPKPGPEHELLKIEEGTWDVVATLPDGKQDRGLFTAKVDCGGFCLVSELADEKKTPSTYQGRGVMGYDAAKKKYVSVWIDNLTFGSPIVAEGTYDKASKTYTGHGEAVGPDGKLTTVKSVRKQLDDDHFTSEGFATGPDGKETKIWSLAFTRRK
jgi:hypothetical protein